MSEPVMDKYMSVKRKLKVCDLFDKEALFVWYRLKCIMETRKWLILILRSG